jgi:radical SAM superfamily enzyme YgiQ (UPF0313 family)
MTRRAGIRVGASFMIGNVNEEIEDLEQTFNLAKAVKPDYTIFFFAIPYPGTEIRQQALKKNLLRNEPTYGGDWSIRASVYPMIVDKLSANTLQTYRSKFQNYFFIKNYLRLENLVIYLQLFWILLKFPSTTWQGIKMTLKDKRLDSFIEYVLETYRKSLYDRFY